MLTSVNNTFVLHMAQMAINHQMYALFFKSEGITCITNIFFQNRSSVSGVNRCISGPQTKSCENNFSKYLNRLMHFLSSCPTQQIHINIIIIIVWLVLEWTLLFPRLTSMQKARSWKILQMRCPRSSPGKHGQNQKNSLESTLGRPNTHNEQKPL